MKAKEIWNVYTWQRHREPGICLNCAQLLKLFHKFSKSLIDVSCGVMWRGAARRGTVIIQLYALIEKSIGVSHSILWHWEKIKTLHGLNDKAPYDGYHSEIFDVIQKKLQRTVYKCATFVQSTMLTICFRYQIENACKASQIRQKPNNKMNESHTNKRENLRR